MKKAVQVSRSTDPQINTVVAAIKRARRNIGKRQEILVPVIPLLDEIGKKYPAEALDLARKVKGEANKDLTSRNPEIYEAVITADSYLQRFILSKAPVVELHL